MRQLSYATAADPAVAEGWVFGSGAVGELDEWSDLDVALVVPADDVARVANPAWLSVLGPVWTYQTFPRERGSGIRAAFADGRLVDLIAVTDRDAIPPERRRLDCDLPEDGRASAAVPLPVGYGSEGDRPAVLGGVDLPSLVHEFRFMAALAVRKCGRDDLLIGGHLALELPRQCLVVAMLLRDRDAGSAHHRFGGPWNDVLDQAFDLIPELTSGRDGVLDLVDASAGLFDELAGKLWPAYEPDWSGLTALLDRARAS